MVSHGDIMLSRVRLRYNNAVQDALCAGKTLIRAVPELGLKTS